MSAFRHGLRLHLDQRHGCHHLSFGLYLHPGQCYDCFNTFLSCGFGLLHTTQHYSCHHLSFGLMSPSTSNRTRNRVKNCCKSVFIFFFSFYSITFEQNLQQSWLPAFWKKTKQNKTNKKTSKTHKRLKRALSIWTKQDNLSCPIKKRSF